MKATGLMALLWALGIISLGAILALAYVGAIIAIPLLLGFLIYIGITHKETT